MTLRVITPARISRAVARRVQRARDGARLRRQRLHDFAPVPMLVGETSRIDTARVPAVDVHNHLGTWLNEGRSWMTPEVGELLATMDATGLSTIINLDGRWGSELEANLDRYDRAHPGRFATFCQLDWSQLGRAGFAERLDRMLRRSADSGACGIKVWKDLGLAVRDVEGRIVQPDDPRLSDLWALAGELGLPVLIHTADPAAFWCSLDRHNERFEQLTRHPDWHHGAKAVPAHRELVSALERLVAAHPGTTFVAAHLASDAGNLAGVSRMLDEHANLFVDLSACEAELGRQPRASRAFLLRYSDRVLWGTDSFGVRVDHYRTWFRLLESADEYFPYSDGPPELGRWAVSGLDLPHEVLGRIYADNARRVVPRLALTSPVAEPSGAGRPWRP